MIKKIIFLFTIFLSFLFLKPVYADFIPKNIDIRAVITDSDETEVLENTIEFPDSMKVVIDLTNSSGFPEVVTRTVVQFDSSLFEVLDSGGGEINGSGTQVIFTLPELLENEDKHFEVVIKPKTDLLPNAYKSTIYVSVSNRYGSKLVQLVSNVISSTKMELNLWSTPVVNLNIDKPEIRYVVTVKNSGSSMAKNTIINFDTTPLNGSGLIENISNGGGYDVENNSITWNIAELNQSREITLTFDLAITSMIENEISITTSAKLTNDYLGSILTSYTSSNVIPVIIIPPVTPDPVITEQVAEVPVKETTIKPDKKIAIKKQTQLITKYIAPVPAKKEIKLVEVSKVIPAVQGLTDEVITKDKISEVKPGQRLKWALPLVFLAIIFLSSILILKKKRT